jgi:hypothetical protein
MFRRVDFPAPFGPATTRTRPGSSVPLTAASTLRFPKRLTTPRNSTEISDTGRELTTTWPYLAGSLRIGGRKRGKGKREMEDGRAAWFLPFFLSRFSLCLFCLARLRP